MRMIERNVGDRENERGKAAASRPTMIVSGVLLFYLPPLKACIPLQAWDQIPLRAFAILSSYLLSYILKKIKKNKTKNLSSPHSLRFGNINLDF